MEDPLTVATFVQRALAEYRGLLSHAEQRLGRRCLAFELDWSLTWVVNQLSPKPRHFGIGDLPAIRTWGAGSSGHSLTLGFAEFEVPVAGRRVRLLCGEYPRPAGRMMSETVWMCAEEDARPLYRFLRREALKVQPDHPPLLSPHIRQQLWDNTIGFLQKGKEIWEAYQVPLRRGVMLLGEPGNGKTMAARWLRSQLNEHGFEWKAVTGEEYDRARAQGTVVEALSLDDPGIIFLDDFDRGLESREQNGVTRDHSALLAALDGMETREGVVYVFTSNLHPADIDPAVRRPGRIDTFIHFTKPDLELRRRFFEEYWPTALRPYVPTTAVMQTEGLSYAELDELKKLLVLHYCEHRVWDWNVAWSQFEARNRELNARTPMGFAFLSGTSSGPMPSRAETACRAH